MFVKSFSVRSEIDNLTIGGGGYNTLFPVLSQKRPFSHLTPFLDIKTRPDVNDMMR